MRAILIDCGVGNMFSIKCALERTGLNVNVSSELGDFKGVDAIILPGVGNFKVGAENLQRIKGEITHLVECGVPLLGICLGMQLLFQESDESPGVEGLSLLLGRVVRLPKNVKTPHMGWNTLKIVKSADLLEGVSERDYFYFVHRYYAVPSNAQVIAAETNYGVSFASVMVKKNIFGVQFHPEKSGKPGERIIKNFTRIIKR